MTVDRLIAEIHGWIIDVCEVADPPAAPAPDAPLIGPLSPYGLDSLDAMEIVVTLQKRYGVRVGSQELSRTILTSLRTLAAYVEREGGRPAAG
jgi:acyl carrier protein